MKKMFQLLVVSICVFALSSIYGQGVNATNKKSDMRFFECWKYIEGSWYYFDESGLMITDWLYDDGNWYYLNHDGSMATGWLNNAGNWYYLNHDGSMATGWLNNAGNWYYLNYDGSMVIGWKIINNHWYFFHPNGSMASGQKIDDYYVNEEGIWVENPIHFSELTVELSEEEYFYDGVEKKPEVIVWDAEGRRLTENKDYNVFYEKERIAIGQYEVEIKFKGNYVGSRSLYFRIVTNPMHGKWIQDKIGWWYRKADGSYPRNGWGKIDGVWYYFDKIGYRMTGWILDGGKWYYLQEKGNREETAHLTNLYEGVMLRNAWFGDKDGQLYYLQSDGAMKIGWLYQNQKWYYLKSNGAMAKNQWIDGHYVDEDGVWQP